MDRIDYNVEQASMQVEKGFQQLEKVSSIYIIPKTCVSWDDYFGIVRK